MQWSIVYSLACFMHLFIYSSGYRLLGGHKPWNYMYTVTESGTISYSSRSRNTPFLCHVTAVTYSDSSYFETYRTNSMDASFRATEHRGSIHDLSAAVATAVESRI